MQDTLLEIINTVRENKNLAKLETIEPNMDLRVDIGFDSLDLAELTVRIEKATGIDVFADSFVNTVGEIQDKLRR